MENKILQKLDSIESKLAVQKNIFNIDELAAFTGFSKSFIYKMTMQQAIPHFKRGKFIFFDRVEVEKWIKENPIKTKQDIDNEAINHTMPGGKK